MGVGGDYGSFRRRQDGALCGDVSCVSATACSDGRDLHRAFPHSWIRLVLRAEAVGCRTPGPLLEARTSKPLFGILSD